MARTIRIAAGLAYCAIFWCEFFNAVWSGGEHWRHLAGIFLGGVLFLILAGRLLHALDQRGGR